MTDSRDQNEEEKKDTLGKVQMKSPSLDEKLQPITSTTTTTDIDHTRSNVQPNGTGGVMTMDMSTFQTESQFIQYLNRLAMQSTKNDDDIKNANSLYVDALYEYATFLWKKTRYVESERICRKILGISPKHSDAHNRLGTNLKAQREYEEAKLHYHYAIKYSQEKHKIAYNNLANVLSMERNTSFQAIHCYLKAIEIDPLYVTAYTNYGIHLQEIDRHQEAIEQYEKALKISPKDAPICSKLANAYSALNDPLKADHWYREMLRCDDGFVSGISDYAVFLHRQHSCQRAKQMYERALNIDNHRPLALRNYALLLQELRFIHEAFYHLDMATTVAMQNKHLNNNNHATKTVSGFKSLKQYWLDESITFREDMAEDKIILNDGLDTPFEDGEHGASQRFPEDMNEQAHIIQTHI